MTPKRFSDFAKEARPLEGTKVRIDTVLNRQILITGCVIKKSKFPQQSDRYLTIQFKMDDKDYVVFSGSTVLTEQLIKYGDQIPFVATIKKIDRFYTLS